MAASYKKLFKLLIDRDMKKKELALEIIERLEKEYPEWKKMLSAVNCIYIITDRKTGKNYIFL